MSQESKPTDRPAGQPAEPSRAPSKAEQKAEQKRRQAAAKAEKCRLTGATLTVAICADTREAGCASAGQLRESWKYLKRRTRQIEKETGVRITAIPTQCVDVCKFGPLMTVQPDGVWYGRCSPEAIDEILTAHLTQSPPPEGHRLDAIDTAGCESADQG